VSLAKQSRYLQQGAYIGYKDPRVKLLTQYEWRDERVRRSASDAYSGWQSGLRTVADSAKPSLASFANPFVVDQRPGSRSVRLWGQVRPGDTHRVTVQRRKRGSTRWTTVKSLSTNASGYWKLTQTVTATTDYRFRWQPTDAYDAPVGNVRTSDVQRVTIARR
jgi:hypothetical protein